VIITGHGTFDNAIQAIKIGAYDYIRKPFSTNDLKLCLRRYQERQTLKEKVKEAEQRYFHLVHNIPLLIFVIRRDFRLDFINQACYMMLGFSPEEAMGNPNWFLDRIHTEDNTRIKRDFQSAFGSAGTTLSAEFRLMHKNGHPIPVIVKSIPFSWDKKTEAPDKMEGYIVDISDRVFLEKALVQREKLKTLGTISAEVAHEIRNPLVALGGFARRLQSRFPGLTECDIILRETERLEKLLDRIRNYLRPVDIVREHCDLNTIIQESIDLLSPEMERRNILCDLTLNPNLPLIITDPDILKQVLINLLRNAMEAMEEEKGLFIRSYENENHLHIDLKNTISKPLTKNPEVLFLPFDEGGQSIGLPLCYQLVKNMGGLLSFTQGPRHMTFTISLPKKAGNMVKKDPPNVIGSNIPVSKENLEERRLDSRFEVNLKSTLKTARKAVEGIVKNISPGGAYIVCEDPPNLFETFQMFIQPPEGENIATMGQVTWKKFNASATSGSHGIGTRFINLNSDAKNIIEQMNC
jgi:PAS domain S-box-containing protein